MASFTDLTVPTWSWNIKLLEIETEIVCDDVCEWQDITEKIVQHMLSNLFMFPLKFVLDSWVSFSGILVGSKSQLTDPTSPTVHYGNSDKTRVFMNQDIKKFATSCTMSVFFFFFLTEVVNFSIVLGICWITCFFEDVLANGQHFLLSRVVEKTKCFFLPSRASL